jgi:YegS/Rv2252/BmrU family lipid kinase
MKIYFIVKPLGTYELKKLHKSIEATFDKKKDSLQILNTLKKGHAIDLAQKAIHEKADLLVACGGDGTINEVARGLVGTEIPLAIIPLGSGNGIARHFKIPFGISKAVHLIKKNKVTKMDVGEVNGYYFFGNMGCALESHFIRTYQKNKWHGIWAYIIALLDAILSFRYQKIKIEYDENSQTISPFVLLVSNTNQQGYDFSLTPQALSNDGLMDVFWMERSNFFNTFIFVVNALMRRKLTTKGCNLIRLSGLKISLLESSDLCVQIDGEFLLVKSKHLEVKVLPKQLNVIVP